jgi:hypothetical protein
MDELSPLETHFALLNAKDGLALDLIAGLYAAHPDGARLIDVMEKRLRNQSHGPLPIGDAAQALTDRELDWFKGRVAEIRALLKHR